MMFYSINSASTSIQRRQVGIRRKNSREFISMGLFAIVFSLLAFTGVRSSYHRRFKYIPFYPLEEQLLFRLPEMDTEAYGEDTDDDSESGFSGEELVEVKKEVQSLTDLVDGFLKELDPDSEKTSSPKKPGERVMSSCYHSFIRISFDYRNIEFSRIKITTFNNSVETSHNNEYN